MKKITQIFLLILSLWLLTVTPSQAAAPRFIMIYGASLKNSVILTDWYENLDFMYAISESADVTPEELAQRPFLELAYFWGPSWAAYADSGKSLKELKPEQANQNGRFYPAFGDARPVATFGFIPGPGSLIRHVNAKGLEILSRHDVPVRLETRAELPTTASKSLLQDWRTWLSISGIALCLFGIVIVVRRYHRNPLSDVV